MPVYKIVEEKKDDKKSDDKKSDDKKSDDKQSEEEKKKSEDEKKDFTYTTKSGKTAHITNVANVGDKVEFDAAFETEN